MEAMLERAATSKSDRNLVRLWASTSHELEIDRQGRMAIPARLREYAGLVGGRPGARGDRPGRAVESSGLGREGPARGGATHPGRRRLSGPVVLHVVRPAILDEPSPESDAESAPEAIEPDRPGRISPDHPRRGRRGDRSTETGGGRLRTIVDGGSEHPVGAVQRFPSADAGGPRPMSRAWPQWPATRCTSNVSGPCAVPRPELWKNPPPPTSRVIVAALHPQASCRSGDCG